MNKRLENYFQLVSRVDELCKTVETALHGHIRCVEGCSSCCKSITLFPVEAEAVRAAIDGLTNEEAGMIRRHAAANAGAEVCPLLADCRCLIYRFRPIICRTHGLPIMFDDGGERRVDYCPENLRECKTLPGSAVIDLDRLNALLVAVNSLFMQESGSNGDSVERVTIVEAVLGDK